MDFTQTYRGLLQTNIDTFCWAARQVPAERQYIAPSDRPKAWSVARIVFHLMYYDEQIALMNMRQWLTKTIDPEDIAHIEYYQEYENLAREEEKAWSAEPDIETILIRLRASRAQQIALVSELPTAIWEETRATVWGEVTLYWTAAKIIHHATQHTGEVLLRALYWEDRPTTL